MNSLDELCFFPFYLICYSTPVGFYVAHLGFFLSLKLLSSHMFGPSPATKSPKRACFQHDFEEHHAYHPDAMHSTYSLWFFYYASGRPRTITCSKQHHSKQLQQLQATLATPAMLMNGDIPGRYRWPKLCHETMRVGCSGSMIFICYSLNYILLVH